MKLFPRSILFFAIASFSPLASGALVDWTNTGTDTSFDNGANWTTITGTGTVPSAGDTTHVFPGFTATANTAFTDITITAGGSNTITINTSNNEAVQNFLVSSNFEGRTVVGTLNLNFNSNSTFTVGSGGITIVGDATTNFAGNLTSTTGELIVGTTSSTIDAGLVTGPGTLNISSGTFNFDSPSRPSIIIGQDTTGTINQGVDVGTLSSVTVNSGATLTIGTSGGTGTYSVLAGSILNIGNFNAPLSNFYTVQLGATTGSIGTLNLSDSSTLNATNPDTLVELGLVAGSTGSINQSGSALANIGATGGGLIVGLGGVGTYTLQDNAILNLTGNSFIIGESDGSTGTFNQLGQSNLVVGATTTSIGSSGTGKYTLAGSATADFQNGFTAGGGTTGSGTITQSGSSTLTAEGLVTLGGTTATGAGIYNLEGGTATFNKGLTVNETGQLNVSGSGALSLGTAANSLTVNAGGSVSQTGGTVTIDPTLGQTLDLSAVGSSYTLGGDGVLQIANNGLVGTSGEGTLNLSGGTLQITSGTTFTDPLDGTLLGTSTIDTSATPAVTSFTLSGHLTGTGGLIFNGVAGTVFTIAPTTGHDFFTGITSIETGTLVADMADVGACSQLNIGSNGTFDLTVDSTGNAFAGSITGAGGLNLTFAAAGQTLAVEGTNNFTGTIKLGTDAGNGGTLQIYGGTFGNITEGTGTGSSVVIGGSLPGGLAGSFTPPTTGTVTLNGASNTYTGLTTVNAGFTLLASNLAGSVNNLGNLGTLGSTTKPANLTFTGATSDLTSTGSILVHANGTNADEFTANTASLSGKIAVTGYGTTATPLPIVVATTALSTGTLNDPNGLSSNSGTLYQTRLSAGGVGNNTLYLQTTQLPLSPFATTPNQAAVAGALDPVLQTPPADFAPILTALNNLPAGAIPGALDQLSPESLQYSRTISIENSTFLASEVGGVLANLRAGFEGIDYSGFRVVDSGFNNNLGTSLDSMLAYNAPSFNRPAPNGVNYYPQDDTGSSSTSPSTTTTTTTITTDTGERSISDSPNPETTTAPSTLSRSEPDFKGPRLNEFILGNVVLADLNEDRGSPNAAPTKASYTAGNMAGGVSFRMTSNLSAGVLFDYNHTDAKTDSNGSKTKVDSYSPGIFGTYSTHGFFVNGLFAFGYNNYSNTREIPFLGTTASSKPSGQQYVTNVDLGYDYQPRNHRQWIFGPNLGLTYTHLDIDSFNETGAGPADLMIGSQSVDSLRSRLGGHVTYQARSGAILFQPTFSAMWQHEYLDDGSGITSQFSIPGTTPFTIQTANSGKDSALLGVGLTATLDNSMAFYLDYLADVGASDYFAQSIEGGFKASF